MCSPVRLHDCDCSGESTRPTGVYDLRHRHALTGHGSRDRESIQAREYLFEGVGESKMSVPEGGQRPR